MLKFDKASQLEYFLTSQAAIEEKVNYLEGVLKPALLRGNWDELEDMVVYKDNKRTILFGDDKWAFQDTEIKGKGVKNILFSIHGSMPTNVLRMVGDERNLRNQIKCMALARIYFVTQNSSLGAIKNAVCSLRNNASYMIARGVNSFEALTAEVLRTWIDDGLDLSPSRAFLGLNALHNVKGVLPFKVNFGLLSHNSFNIKLAEIEQYCVIPPRLYFATLNEFNEIITAAYAARDEIKRAVEEMLEFEQQEKESVICNIRNGGSLKSQLSVSKSFRDFCDALDAAVVSVADNEEDERWMTIFKERRPTLFICNGRTNKFQVVVGGKNYNWVDFRSYISALTSQAAFLCMALSGMRVDELWRMHPGFGAQRVQFDKDGNESESGKEVIYFLSTRQSKISMNSQTKDDLFVTTLSGWKAFYVLNAIHEPLRALFPEGESNRMFASLRNTQFPSATSKNQLGFTIKKYCNIKHGFDLILTEQDMNYLNASDSTQKSLKLGEKFRFQNHQLRRSLAYYLIGYELCSFPALKQQLGHFSMAMTRWYARNASSLQKLYSEIQHERRVQHADIFVRIYNKLANGERIAGGKGKAAMIEIAKQGNSYFENAVNKRLLSREYWIDALENGRAHLHAIAPGIICTNNQCSMRINIDLTECVGCEFDYIENVVYAESARMDAMRNLNLLIEYKELNPSSASKYHMQIKAAEKIMQDLEFEYEPYEFQEEVTQMLIETPVVMVV